MKGCCAGGRITGPRPSCRYCQGALCSLACLPSHTPNCWNDPHREDSVRKLTDPVIVYMDKLPDYLTSVAEPRDVLLTQCLASGAGSSTDAVSKDKPKSKGRGGASHPPYQRSSTMSAVRRRMLLR